MAYDERRSISERRKVKGTNPKGNEQRSGQDRRNIIRRMHDEVTRKLPAKVKLKEILSMVMGDNYEVYPNSRWRRSGAAYRGKGKASAEIMTDAALPIDSLEDKIVAALLVAYSKARVLPKR